MSFSVPMPILFRTEIDLSAVDRPFEHLVIAEAAFTGYLRGHLLQAGSVSPGSPIRHVCLSSQAEVECDVQPVFDAIVRYSWPSEIRFAIDPMPAPAALARTIMPTGVQRLTAGLFAQAFIAYYESIVTSIVARFGSDAEAWPEVLKFARMIRNAVGHGGKLEIRNPRATVSWRGLSLNSTNNGEALMYQHLACGDLILLMLDADNAL